MEEENLKTKRMSYVAIISIAMTLVIILVASYAIWQAKKNQTGSNKLLGACLDISYDDNEDGISLTDAWPISDEEGKVTEGYTFTIENKCDKDVPYEVVLESLTPNGNQMPGDYVKVMIDDKPIKTYSSLELIENDSSASYKDEIVESRIVYTGMLKKGEPKTHTVRTWFSLDATPDTVGYKFSSRVKVIAGQGITVPDTPIICYEIDDNGMVTKYNPECGRNVVVPASYNGKDIKSIDTYAFYDIKNYIKDGYSIDDVDIAVSFSSKIIDMMEKEDESLLATLTNEDVRIIKYKDTELVDQVIELLKEEEPLSTIKTSIENNGYQLNGTCLSTDSNCNHLYYSIYYDVEDVKGDCEEIGIYVDTDEPIEKEYAPVFVADTIDLSNATNLETINMGTFSGYVGTGTSLVLPNSLKTIDDGAFSGFNGDSITLPSNLETIGISAFREYQGIGTTLTIPSTVKTIEEDAFNRYNGDAIILNDGLEKIYCNAFARYNGATITIPSTVTRIGGGQETSDHGSGSQCWPDNRVFRYMEGSFIAKNQYVYDNRSTWATNGNQVTLDLN